MEKRAIGLLELNSVAAGILAADQMVKSSEVELLMARPVCPGRYLALVAGDTGAVEHAVKVGREAGGSLLVDWFVIPNVHEAVFPALSAASQVTAIDALGIVETYSSASCVLAADAAAKAGSVMLIELRLATGLAGKSYLTLTGQVDAVRASVAAGVAAVAESGLVLNQVVIPAPHPALRPKLL